MINVESVCVVGVGLMGGSLALALRQADPALRIVGVGRDPETLAVARRAGAIDEGTTDLAAALVGADIVVLATPVRTILRLLPEVGRHARRGTLILDLGSSKQQICAAMEDLPAGLEPVGGHPLCGKEQAGFAVADASLYHDRPFVLCPLARTAPAAHALAEGLARTVGAQPVILSPADHDRAVAAISHLPYALAVTLVQSVAAAGDAVAWRLAASGFRDTWRVAASDVDMMLDTLLTNRAAVLAWMETFADQWNLLRDTLAVGDEAALRAQLATARARRIAAGKAAGW